MYNCPPNTILTIKNVDNVLMATVIYPRYQLSQALILEIPTVNVVALNLKIFLQKSIVPTTYRLALNGFNSGHTLPYNFNLKLNFMDMIP